MARPDQRFQITEHYPRDMSNVLIASGDTWEELYADVRIWAICEVGGMVPKIDSLGSLLAVLGMTGVQFTIIDNGDLLAELNFLGDNHARI